MRSKVKVDVKGTVTHTIGASATREPVADVASVAGAVPLSRTNLLTASKRAAAAIILSRNVS